MNILYKNSLYITLLTIKPDAPKSATASVKSINDILQGVCIGIGVIVLIYAIIKLLMAFAEENSKMKMDAAMLTGGGIFFLSIGKVIQTLNLSAKATTFSIVKNTITLVSNLFEIVGVVLVIFSIIILINSYLQERSEQIATGTNLLAVAAGCLYVKNIGNEVIRNIAGGNATGALTTTLTLTKILQMIGNFVSSAMMYSGATLGAISIVKIIYAIKEDQTKEKADAAKLFGVAVALMSLSVILKKFGII